MKFRKNCVIGVVLLAMLIDSSVSRNKSYRLPRNAIPQLYTIKIEPNIGNYNLTWTGEVTIDIDVVNSTRSLILHAHPNLLIDENSTRLIDGDGNIRFPIEHSRDDDLEFLSLEFDREISVGNYGLHIRYSGYQSDEFEGLSKVSHGIEGSPMVVGTDFQPTAARRVFPCWDEPHLKARFSITIVHSKKYTALSNMPDIASTEVANGKNMTTFAATPMMSTYLLNFVIADYKAIHNAYRNVSLYGSSLEMETAEHVMDLSPKAIRVMESYTGFLFGFPKIGSVLMPRYRPAAMEQWGLVSYKERLVSLDENVNTTSEKDKAYMTIAHEIAHSWFGNRVTPFWWDDLWISEGFSTYFQYYIMDEVYDNWGGSELFILMNNYESAFELDNVRTIPVKWRPPTNEDIMQLFELLTYHKGAAIIHMYRNVIGDDVFRAGIRKIMAKYSFKSVNAADVMRAFQEAYNRSPHKQRGPGLIRTMRSWLTQDGYPVISVRRNYTSGDTELFQKSNQDSPRHKQSEKWWVPLTFATKSNPNFTSTIPVIWMSDRDDSVKLHGIGKNDWIVLNIRASGYYRINYDDENWDKLIKYLNSDNYTNIHVLNRVQLLSDAIYFLSINKTHLNYEIFYGLTKYLSREIEYSPWRVAIGAITEIDESIVSPTERRMFREHFFKLMERFVEKVGFEVRDTDDHFTKLSRLDVIQWACKSGHSGCSNYAAKKLIGLMENPAENRLHPDTKSWTFCAGLRGLNNAESKQFADWAYQNARDLLVANADCTENHEIHEYLLRNSLKNLNDGHSREFADVFLELLKTNDENFNFTVNYFLKNYKTFLSDTSTVIDEQNLAPFLVDAVLNELTNNARLEKFKEILRLDACEELQIPYDAESTAIWLANLHEANAKNLLMPWQSSRHNY